MLRIGRASSHRLGNAVAGSTVIFFKLVTVIVVVIGLVLRAAQSTAGHGADHATDSGAFHATAPLIADDAAS